MKKLFLSMFVVVLVVSTLAVFSLSGCKTEEGIEEAVEEVAEAIEEEMADEEMTEEVEVLPAMDIDIWDWQPGPNYLAAMEENFEVFKTLNPQYANVNFIHTSSGADYWTLLTPAIAAGEGVPDMFGIIQSNTELFDSLIDLRPIISSDAEWMAQYEHIDSPDLGTSGLDDKVHGVAIDKWVAGIFYYKDMLEKYNLPIPVTVEDFIAMVPVLEADGIEVLAQGGDGWTWEELYAFETQMLLPISNPAGVAKDWFTGDLKYDSEENRIALQAIKDLYDGGVWREDELQLFQFAEAIQNFLAKKAFGYWVGGTWWAGSMNPEDLEANNVGILPAPVPPGGTPGVFQQSTGQMYGVYTDIAPEKMEVALAFLKYMSSPEAVEVYLKNNILPAGNIPEGMSSPNSLINESIEAGIAATEAGLIYDPHQWDLGLGQPTMDAITSTLLGLLTIDEALAEMRANQDEVIARVAEERGQ